ncbi:MAG: hypothetical protein BWX98_01197 [Candidatus Aminicenantes bacterium ADurb.Bin147]|nr:MAG: hypothetical protein BWX98_01197 [Candidatus Aminicenantes bacterium ADurb.Bin147]
MYRSPRMTARPAQAFLRSSASCRKRGSARVPFNRLPWGFLRVVDARMSPWWIVTTPVSRPPRFSGSKIAALTRSTISLSPLIRRPPSRTPMILPSGPRTGAAATRTRMSPAADSSNRVLSRRRESRGRSRVAASRFPSRTREKKESRSRNPPAGTAGSERAIRLPSAAANDRKSKRPASAARARWKSSSAFGWAERGRRKSSDSAVRVTAVSRLSK